jgi:hypothetical protein
MSLWKSIFEELPVDQSENWVRHVSNYRQPFLCVWDSGNMTFVSVTTSVSIPAYMIQRWKSA